MYVLKRDGRKEPVKLDKIVSRIKKLCFNLDSVVEPMEITKKVINGLNDGVTTTELDILAAETAASLSTLHPDYALLAGRIAVSLHHKSTKKSFTETMKDLYNNFDDKNNHIPLVSKQLYDIVVEHGELIDSNIIHDRDFDYNFFGFKTLEKSYLLKKNKEVIERPQHMLMRVAIGIWQDDLDNVFKYYNYMSERWFTHATPTLFNSGTPKPQMSSCFLLTNKDDSIEGIYDSIKDCAHISKYSGGIGVNVSNIRGKQSIVKGTGGISSGLIPFLKSYESVGRAVNQGGKRNGSIAVYNVPHHCDIFDFLDLRKNQGKEEFRTRDLFTALFVSDLFMNAVENNEPWFLFSYDDTPELFTTYGEEFEQLYKKCVELKLYRSETDARLLWNKITESLIETGTPYILYKDAINRSNMQNNVGVINNSNLCAEIIEFSGLDKDENEHIAVCNLASLNLSKFIKKTKSKNIFDFNKLWQIAYDVTISLDKVIDMNFYPLPETKYSNMNLRPIGLGVQGLADVYALLKIAFDSNEASEINKTIFETIYHAQLSASCDLAKKLGAYNFIDKWENSHAKNGKLHIDFYNWTSLNKELDWAILRENIKTYGVRNSLLSAIMPTASTASILDNNEACEAFTSNIFLRRTLSGEYPMINKHLVKDLSELNLWNKEMSNKIIMESGSIQNIKEIPQHIKDLYKTVWEISQRSIINQSIDRQPFIDQTQSMN
jgi:ribonucleoside-diphosphate reductase alpha chain